MGPPSLFKSAGHVLLWSGLLAAATTALGFQLNHPARVLPSAIGALTIPIFFVSLCKVLWRMRKAKSRATDAVYSRQEQTLYNWLALALRSYRFQADAQGQGPETPGSNRTAGIRRVSRLPPC